MHCIMSYVLFCDTYPNGPPGREEEAKEIAAERAAKKKAKEGGYPYVPPAAKRKSISPVKEEPKPAKPSNNPFASAFGQLFGGGEEPSRSKSSTPSPIKSPPKPPEVSKESEPSFRGFDRDALSKIANLQKSIPAKKAPPIPKLSLASSSSSKAPMQRQQTMLRPDLPTQSNQVKGNNTISRKPTISFKSDKMHMTPVAERETVQGQYKPKKDGQGLIEGLLRDAKNKFGHVDNPRK